MADDGFQPYIDSQMAKVQVILDETKAALIAAGYKAPKQIGEYVSPHEDGKPITPYAKGPAHQERIDFIDRLGASFAAATAVGPHGVQAIRRNYWLLFGLAAIILIILGGFALVVIFTALKLTH